MSRSSSPRDGPSPTGRSSRRVTPVNTWHSYSWADLDDDGLGPTPVEGTATPRRQQHHKAKISPRPEPSRRHNELGDTRPSSADIYQRPPATKYIPAKVPSKDADGCGSNACAIWTAVIFSLLAVVGAAVAVTLVLLLSDNGNANEVTTSIDHVTIATDAAYVEQVLVSSVEVTGSASFGDLVYTDEYGDSTSSEYQELETNFTSQMDVIFLEGENADIYNGTYVTGFSAGSIIVDFVVVLLDVDDQIESQVTQGSEQGDSSTYLEQIQAVAVEIVSEVLSGGTVNVNSTLTRIGIGDTSANTAVVNAEIITVVPTESPSTQPQTTAADTSTAALTTAAPTTLTQTTAQLTTGSISSSTSSTNTTSALNNSTGDASTSATASANQTSTTGATSTSATANQASTTTELSSSVTAAATTAQISDQTSTTTSSSVTAAATTAASMTGAATTAASMTGAATTAATTNQASTTSIAPSTSVTAEEATAEEVTEDAEEVTADDEEVTWKMTTVDHVTTDGDQVTSESGKTGPTMDTYTGVTNTGATTEEPTMTPKDVTTEDSDPS